MRYLVTLSRTKQVLVMCCLIATSAAVASALANAGATHVPARLPASEDLLEKYAAPAGGEVSLKEVSAIASAKAALEGVNDPRSLSVTRGKLQDAISTLNPGSVEEDSAPTMVSKAKISSGQAAWMHTAVYVVSMHGTFTMQDAKIPRGEKMPTGTVLTLIIDAHSGIVEGRSLTYDNPRLTNIGPVVPLN